MTTFYLIEQELARRCGPFLDDVLADSGSTWTYNPGVDPTRSAVVLPTLQSSLDLGDEWTGRYILRRGLLQGSSGLAVMPTSPPSGHVPNYQTGPLNSDRVRRIASVDYTTGTVTPDRPWTNYPASNELIELHYLEPTKQLRVAATAGLDRCYVEDRVALTTTGQATERDLTALASWITQKEQVKNVQWNYVGSYLTAMDVQQFTAYYQNGHVWLSVSPDPYPNSLLVTARRPISSTIGGQIGPTTGASIAFGTPATVSLLNHGLTTGMVVEVTDSATANGTWVVTVLDSNTFTLDGSSTTASVSFTATVARVVPPYAETDDFPVTIDYAAAAGLCAVWEKFPALLIGGAQIGLLPTMAQAAASFSKQTDANYQSSERRVGFDAPFPRYTTFQRV